MQNTDIDRQSRPALAARVRLQIDQVDGGPVLLYPEGLLRLNDTAHEVLTRCDGKNTVAEIIALLAAEYDVDEATLSADVAECLAQFHQQQLLVFKA